MRKYCHQGESMPHSGFRQLNPACALRALAIVFTLSFYSLSLSLPPPAPRRTNVPLSAALAGFSIGHVFTPLQRDPSHPHPPPQPQLSLRQSAQCQSSDRRLLLRRQKDVCLRDRATRLAPFGQLPALLQEGRRRHARLAHARHTALVSLIERFL